MPCAGVNSPEGRNENMEKYKPKVYISGPMSGLGPDEVQRRFNAAELQLHAMGYDPVNPAHISVYPFDYDEFMEIDLKILSYCDGIYMLKGWKDSFGAQMELQYAVMKQHFIMYEDESEAVEC